jgi:hypothetical protein
MRIKKFWQDGFSIREKGVNYINTPPMFDTVFNIFKTFTKGKVKDRVSLKKLNKKLI